MRRRLPLLLVLALALAGCGGSDAEPKQAAERLTPAELGWVREYSRWTIDVWDEELGHDPGAALVRECSSRLAEVGAPPTERLKAAAARAQAVCPLLERRGSTRRALDAIEDADDLIRPFLLESRTLPLRDGEARGSRADVDLSDVASEWAETPVEVRCWSRPEWRRIVRENNAWADGSDDAEELVGFGSSDDSRIHLQLSHCNALASLRRADTLEWAREKQVDLADALVTLAHEIQHFVLTDAEEDEVECAAAETASRVAGDLGASSAEADQLDALYRSELYPELSDEYRGDGCD